MQRALQVDGKEFGVLRKTPKLAFGHCLLYDWLDAMGDGGAKWFTFWKTALRGYKRHDTCVSVNHVL